MAKDFQDTLRELAISALENASKQTQRPPTPSANGSGHSPGRGLAVGLGAAALAPLAVKGMGRVARELGKEELEHLLKSPGKAVQGLTSNVGDRLGSSLGDKVSEKVDQAGGPSGILKDALPFGGGGDDDDGANSDGGLGIGRNRRMPVQQSIDIGAPLETVYNQWTQYEDWPRFMHRVTRVNQDEDTKVSFATRIWGRTKEFTAEIETQRPDERVKWKVSQGITHAGVVTFHELGPNLTRVLLAIDVDPGSLLEKFARGARHIKRAARGDLHRFKAFIEMSENETGAWRGVIEDGEVVEEHDPAYDKGREYSDPDELFDEDADSSGKDDDDDNDEEKKPRARRAQRQPSRNGHGGNSGSGSRTRRAASTRASGSSRTSKRSGTQKSSSSSSRSSGSKRASSRGRSRSGKS